MQVLNWNVFKSKFYSQESMKFEHLSYLLLGSEFQITGEILSYKKSWNMRKF